MLGNSPKVKHIQNLGEDTYMSNKKVVESVWVA